MTKPLIAPSLSPARDQPAAGAEPPLVASANAPDHPGQAHIHTVDAVYRQYAPTVTRWVARLVGRDLEIEDTVHEVFLVVHKRLATFRGDASLSTWLYGVVIRVVADRRRGRRWRRRFGLHGGTDEAISGLENHRAAGPSALERLESQESQRVVYAVLDRLSEANRTALILFEIEGLSGQEIAAVTGMSINGVWVRLHRARKQFTRELLAWEAEHRARERP